MGYNSDSLRDYKVYADECNNNGYQEWSVENTKDGACFKHTKTGFRLETDVSGNVFLSQTACAGSREWIRIGLKWMNRLTAKMLDSNVGGAVYALYPYGYDGITNPSMEWEFVLSQPSSLSGINGPGCGLRQPIFSNKIVGGNVAAKSDWAWQVFDLRLHGLNFQPF
jgi:hypothetical protein